MARHVDFSESDPIEPGTYSMIVSKVEEKPLGGQSQYKDEDNIIMTAEITEGPYQGRTSRTNFILAKNLLFRWRYFLETTQLVEAGQKLGANFDPNPFIAKMQGHRFKAKLIPSDQNPALIQIDDYFPYNTAEIRTPGTSTPEGHSQRKSSL